MTFKNKHIHKLYAFALAAVFALTLAGCGGGGGTAADPEPPAMPEPTPQEMCEGDGGRYNADGSCTSAADLAEEMALSGAQSAAMAAYMAAMAAVSGAVDPVAMSNAQAAADMAKGASDSAAMATTSAMAMEYQMKAEMYRDNAMAAAGMPGLGLIMLANKVLNGDDITNAELDGSTPPKAASNAKNVDAAIAAAGAPVTATGFTNQGGVSGTDTVATVTEVSGTAVAAHRAGGSTFTLELGSGNRFLTGETPSRFETKGGWEAQDLLFQADAATVKTHLVASTDIQATTKKDVYTQATTDADIAVDSVITGDVPNDGSDFVASYNPSTTDNTAGRTGEIYCPSDVTAGCAISVDGNGKVTTVSGYKVSYAKTTEDNIDGDYLAWGFWVTGSVRDTLLNADGSAITADAAQAGAFAYGSMPFAVVAGITGKATYNGVANGLYSAGGMVQYFDADAMLEANFGGATNTAPLAAISGSISNIMAAGQSIDGSLTLERGNINATGGIIGTGPTGTEGIATTDGVLGGNGFRGQWGGQLYGPAARNAAATATTHPTTVAGTFSASTQDDKMSLLGAFGAWKAE